LRDAEGRPSFDFLQEQPWRRARAAPLPFDLLTLRGKDLTRGPLEEHREILRAEVVPRLPDSIRYPKTLEASPAELIEAVREQRIRGHRRAKRRDSPYKLGQRSVVWQKMRFLQRRDFVLDGYTPTGRNFDVIFVGYYQGRALIFVGKLLASRRRCEPRYSGNSRSSKPNDVRSRTCPRRVAVSGAKD
jgi:ATP-dependent DNA ligase